MRKNKEIRQIIATAISINNNVLSEFEDKLQKDNKELSEEVKLLAQELIKIRETLNKKNQDKNTKYLIACVNLALHYLDKPSVYKKPFENMLLGGYVVVNKDVHNELLIQNYENSNLKDLFVKIYVIKNKDLKNISLEFAYQIIDELKKEIQDYEQLILDDKNTFTKNDKIDESELLGEKSVKTLGEIKEMLKQRESIAKHDSIEMKSLMLHIIDSALVFVLCPENNYKTVFNKLLKEYGELKEKAESDQIDLKNNYIHNLEEQQSGALQKNIDIYTNKIEILTSYLISNLQINLQEIYLEKVLNPILQFKLDKDFSSTSELNVDSYNIQNKSYEEYKKYKNEKNKIDVKSLSFQISSTGIENTQKIIKKLDNINLPKVIRIDFHKVNQYIEGFNKKDKSTKKQGNIFSNLFTPSFSQDFDLPNFSSKEKDITQDDRIKLIQRIIPYYEKANKESVERLALGACLSCLFAIDSDDMIKLNNEEMNIFEYNLKLINRVDKNNTLTEQKVTISDVFDDIGENSFGPRSETRNPNPKTNMNNILSLIEETRKLKNASLTIGTTLTIKHNDMLDSVKNLSKGDLNIGDFEIISNNNEIDVNHPFNSKIIKEEKPSKSEEEVKQLRLENEDEYKNLPETEKEKVLNLRSKYDIAFNKEIMETNKQVYLENKQLYLEKLIYECDIINYDNEIPLIKYAKQLIELRDKVKYNNILKIINTTLQCIFGIVHYTDLQELLISEEYTMPLKWLSNRKLTELLYNTLEITQHDLKQINDLRIKLSTLAIENSINNIKKYIEACKREFNFDVVENFDIKKLNKAVVKIFTTNIFATKKPNNQLGDHRIDISSAKLSDNMKERLNLIKQIAAKYESQKERAEKGIEKYKQKSNVLEACLAYLFGFIDKDDLKIQLDHLRELDVKKNIFVLDTYDFAMQTENFVIEKKDKTIEEVIGIEKNVHENNTNNIKKI